VLDGKTDKGSKKRGEEIMKPDPSPKNSPDLAFLVQFRDPREPGAVRFAGRAEHVMSGQNTSFETPEELVSFLGRVVNQLKPRAPKDIRQ
jgi:hypothetical protein